MTSSRDSHTRQLVQSAGNCRAMSIPIRARHIRNIVALGSRQQVRQTMCIAIVLSEQNSERWISTRRKWNEWIIRGESSWNQKLCPDHQLKRRRTKINQVLGRPNGLAESQCRICREKFPIPSADETLNHPELQTSPSGSTLIPIPSGVSSRSGVKRTFSESTGRRRKNDQHQVGHYKQRN